MGQLSVQTQLGAQLGSAINVFFYSQIDFIVFGKALHYY